MPETTAGTFQFFIGNVVLDVFWVFHGGVQRVAKTILTKLQMQQRNGFCLWHLSVIDPHSASRYRQSLDNRRLHQHPLIPPHPTLPSPALP